MFSGSAAAESFQERLAAFHKNESVPLARYENGRVASFDPSSDGGGLGDVLQITAREAAAALVLGRRYSSPHCAGTWRYAVVASRAGLCALADCWACIFVDTFPPLPAGHPDRSAVRDDRPGYSISSGPDQHGADGEGGDATDGALLAHGLHSSQWQPGACDAGLPHATVGAAADAVRPLLSSHDCSFGAWQYAHALRFAW